MVKVFVSARMRSRRLPGKSLKRLAGRPLLWHVVQRAARINGLGGVVVLTSDTARDDRIAAFCAESRIDCVRGPEADVLERHRIAIAQLSPHTIVRLTGDNPFVVPETVRRALDGHLRLRPALTTTRDIVHRSRVQRTLPRGLSFDVLDAPALLQSDSMELASEEREHVIPFFFNRRDRYRIRIPDFGLSERELQLNFSVDTLEDLQRAERIAKVLRVDATLSEVVQAGLTETQRASHGCEATKAVGGQG